MTPFRPRPDYPHWPEVVALIRTEFAYMEPLLGHPARATLVTTDQLAEAANTGTAWLIEDGGQPVACAFTRPSRDIEGALYVGWLAVAGSHRGKGLARLLIAEAEAEARANGTRTLTLDTGRAITDLHRFFRSLGFTERPGTGENITFCKVLG